MTDVSDTTKLIDRLPTPKEVEDIMLQKEAETQKALDGRAQMFMMYMPRLKNQLGMMSKKQVVLLATDLCKSEHTNDEDVRKVMNLAAGLNLNSIVRTLANVIESPLNEKELASFSKKEKKFFSGLEELLAHKYVTYIMNYANQPPTDGQTPRLIQELVTYLPEKKSFDKRDQVEKDSFATANQLLLTKTLMMQHTLLEYLNEEEKKNGQSVNGSEKPSETNQVGSDSN